MELVIITNKYPNIYEPNVLVFLQQLVWEFADQGINCSVICPVPININPKYLNLPYKTYEVTERNNRVTLFYPKYIGFGQKKYFGTTIAARVTTKLFYLAVKRVYKKIKNKNQVLYSHFVTPAGIATAHLGEKFNVPTFMAYGEATTNTIYNIGKRYAIKKLNNLSAIISVSTENKRRLLDMGILDEELIGVFPNGFRKERFYPRDKKECRRKFNLPTNKFIVSFVGSYDERKGINRLIEAIEKLDDVYFISAGKGKFQPNKSSKCLYSNTVNNKDLPYFLSASDLFVLPTTNEGSCNAIIEAMACGLPIVSSNLSFNDDILNDSNSIRVNPYDIDQISKTINIIKNNSTLRKKLSNGSLVQSNDLEIAQRAKKIIKFISHYSGRNYEEIN